MVESQKEGLLEAAKIHAEAVSVIQEALRDMLSVRDDDGKQFALAMLARLAEAGLLVERYSQNKDEFVKSMERVDSDFLALCRSIEVYIGWSAGVPEFAAKRFRDAINREEQARGAIVTP